MAFTPFKTKVVCSVAIGAALMLAVIGCGAGAPATATPTPTAKQAAATAYLAAEAKANGATAAATKLCAQAAPTAAQYKACYTALSLADHVFAQALATIHFPPDTNAADVGALTMALTQSGTDEAAIAASADPNSDYTDASTLQTAEAARIAAASVIRTDLAQQPASLVPKPPPTVTQAAGAAYLAAVTKLNSALSAAGALCPGPNNNNAQIKACWNAYYLARKAFLQDVFAITFPPEIKADVDALIKADTAAESAQYAFSTSPDPSTDFTDFNAAVAAENEGSTASSVIRHDLGLPPVPIVTPAP